MVNRSASALEGAGGVRRQTPSCASLVLDVLEAAATAFWSGPLQNSKTQPETRGNRIVVVSGYARLISEADLKDVPGI